MLKADKNIRKRAASGAAYLAFFSFMRRGLQLLRMGILARILSPADFGIFSLAVVLYQGVRAVSEMGARTYLIQKTDITKDFIGNFWSFNILRGVVMSLIMAGLGPIYAKVVGEPKVYLILIIVAMAPLFEGFVNPSRDVAERELRFLKVTLFDFITVIIRFGVIVLLAFWFRDVKALAWGLVITSFFKFSFSLLYFKIRTIPRFSKRIFKEIFSVGKFLWINSIGTFLLLQADYMIVGALRGVEILGIYVVAYRLFRMPLQFFKNVIKRVSLPYFSRIREKRDPSEPLNQILSVLVFLLVPASITLLVLSSPIIHTIIGKKWLATIPVFQILTFAFLAQGLKSVLNPFIIAEGYFKIISIIRVVEVTLFIILVATGTYLWGAPGAALGVSTTFGITTIVRLVFINYISNLNYRKLLKNISIAIGWVTPGIIAYLVIHTMTKMVPSVSLIIGGATIGASYLLLAITTRRDILENIIGFRKAIRGKKA